jgi:hypothetical protein
VMKEHRILPAVLQGDLQNGQRFLHELHLPHVLPG